MWSQYHKHNKKSPLQAHTRISGSGNLSIIRSVWCDGSRIYCQHVLLGTDKTFFALQFHAVAQLHPSVCRPSVGDTPGRSCVLVLSHSAASPLIHSCGAWWKLHSPGLAAGWQVTHRTDVPIDYPGMDFYSSSHAAAIKAPLYHHALEKGVLTRQVQL